MEARAQSWLLLLVMLPALGASARTKNFVVTAATPALASEMARAAEVMRRDLAQEWLGSELPDWDAPCPVLVKVSPQLGAGGRTSFMFRDGIPFGWEMEVQGSYERVLDSVLPHEVTHTIFATHFGCPLPRWADEGACTTVEHSSERRKQELWLVQFLKTERGIPFNHMFAMREYPGDILPLYSQGYSLARYLIAQGGKPKFVAFVGQGIETGNWAVAVRNFYGYESLGQLQLSWVDWVVDGSKEAAAPAIQLAAATASVAVGAGETEPTATRPRGERPQIDEQLAMVSADAFPSAELPGGADRPSDARSWYARQQSDRRLR
jgi:hypothetical protein